MDSLCLRTGLQGISPAMSVSSSLEVRRNPSQYSAGSAPPVAGGVTVEKPSRFSFKLPFRSLFPGGKSGVGVKGAAVDDAVSVESREGMQSNGGGGDAEEDGNWLLKTLHVKSLWSEQKGEEEEVGDQGSGSSSSSPPCSSSEACGCDYDDDDDEIVFDRSSFSKLLKKVSLSDAKLYAQMSYLGSLAYAIPSIKPGNLLKRHGLQYVTSSIEKREQLVSRDKDEQLANADEMQPSIKGEEQQICPSEAAESDNDTSIRPRISASPAFNLNTHTRSILRPSNAEAGQDMLEDLHKDIYNARLSPEMASFKATTGSLTAVVAAEEEAKQAVANDLNSTSSWPCEWYICDDHQSATRFFVIQGSETLASWQANLLFEPIQFEGLDVLAHRGIYEAAKGMYQQMLPEILAHTKVHGTRARLRFTGHSLGGSLSLLINLMLLIRGEVSVSCLLPVITFGAPSIMCGGDELLSKLKLPRSHVQAVTMHRDIVPRAFSCSYPNHVVELLKALNGSFRNHPCLSNQKLLYSPMGEMLILQPDANFSPQHNLLPTGSGLYLLTSSFSNAMEAEKRLRAAKIMFLNSPHPLEILSDRSAYGNGGTIQRDHDMNSYLKCVRSLIRHELSRIRRAERERRRKAWWPLVLPRIVGGGKAVMGGFGAKTGPGGQLNFSGVARMGSRSLKRFSRLVTSQHMHLLLVLLFPARLLLMGMLGTAGKLS